ncbi:MAG: glycosyltransferase [Actinomycetota bacterium]|nr:glycosyltransferase [Actinomycetota bacterium]
MRIGMFADMYKPHLSGVTNYISLYKQRLEDLGHEVFVITFGNREYHDQESRIMRSPAFAWGSTGWQAGVGLSREARELIPTLHVAHVHHPFLSGRMALRHAKPAGVPIVFTNHTRYDIYSDAYAKFAPRTLRMAFLRTYLHSFAHDIDLVISPSVGIKEWLSDFGITDDAVLLSNCVDTEPFMHPAHPINKSEFGFAEDSVVFCYLGRIGPEKNLGLLVEAFIRAAEADSHVALLLLGDGPARGEAQERLWAHGLTDRVHFAGLMPYARVPDTLAAADVFVTASVSEVHPLVVMEAMAAGLPAIGIISPGVGDIIEDSETGYLTHENAEEFAARMLELACDSKLRERMSAAAQTASAGYDIRIMAEQMLELYRSVGAKG